jgi:hypothetical protein
VQIGPSVNSALASASDATGTYVFGRGFGNALWYNRFDGTSWTGQQVLGGVPMASDPVAVAAPTGIYVFALATNSYALWHGHFDNGVWSGWYPMQGTWTKDLAAVSSNWGLFVFARGTDDAPYYRRLSGGAWGPWTTLLGTISSAPAAAADGNGVYVFARAREGIWTRKFNGAIFEDWVWLGDGCTGDPAAAAASSGVYVFTRATDSGVRANRLSGLWSGFQPLNWGTNGSPCAVTQADGATVHLFVRGYDNNLYAGRYISAGFAGFANLGGPVASGNALA